MRPSLAIGTPGHFGMGMEPIFDADSTVFFDLNAKRQDKADAKRCYVLNAYSPRAYEEEFDDDPATWSRRSRRRAASVGPRRRRRGPRNLRPG